MIPTDRDLVLAAARTYDKSAQPCFEAPGFADRLFSVDTADCVIFSPEGTYSGPGWLGDVLAVGITHPQLGFVHADFYEAAQRLMPPVMAAVKAGRPVGLGGHSRGAALVAIMAGLLIVNGTPPLKTGMYAPPRAGGATLVSIVSAHPFCAYRFGNDPVPDVPFTFDPEYPYRQFALAQIGKPASNPLDSHHITNYVDGVS